MSAISRVIGYEPVDPAFGEIEGRQKWAIPWLESDDFLASPQLWVARTRKDAADALAYGCTGLMGLQWRTRAIGPNVSALAQAAWDQSGWNPAPGRLVPDTLPDQVAVEGPLGGKTTDYPGREISGTDDDLLYQTCRYDLDGYRWKVPNGTYQVTLKFCEPHFDAAGRRVCDVKLQGSTVLQELDIFAEVGKFAALDYIFSKVQVTDGRLKLDIVYRESLPCISAVVIEGKEFTSKINCGGPAWQDYVADEDVSVIGTGRGRPRGLEADDFWTDWSVAMFGPEVADGVAQVFQNLDGNVPQSLGGGCPAGSIRAIDRPWEEIAPTYAFVDELAAFRPKVQGAGNLQRFDYWLATFRYLRLQARVQCALGQFERAMKSVERENDPARRKSLAGETALPLYRELLKHYSEMYGQRLAAVATCGGMATILNLEHNARFWPEAIAKPASRLSAALGGPLPAEALPTKQYRGNLRVIVPTVRTCAHPGESLRLKVILLSSHPPRDAALYFRTLGTKDAFRRIPLEHVARGVYTVALPPLGELGGDCGLGYYVEAATEDG
ncbi:MAG: malectin domain-containing carbohydrate-binding protein [Planctomycetota bacterium]